jgi:hypothetical protein
MKSALSFILVALLTIACGCAQRGPLKVGEKPIDHALLGKRIVISGHAQDRKAGLCVETFAADVVYLPGGFKIPDFKREMPVWVSGVLGEDYALPVFIQEPRELPKGGIPVPPGTDLHAARHRWVLTDAKVEK